MEQGSSPTDPAKYMRLATEYSKMRAQNTVLKKGVLEEQAKNMQLKDELHLKDQTIRKAEQEMDSLTFRNTQLEKRVGFLQDELAAAMNKGKSKNKGKPNAGNSNLDHNTTDPNQPALDYELLSKIEENIALHKQISEMEEYSRVDKKEIVELKHKIEEQARESPQQLIRQEKFDTLEAEKLSLRYSLQNSLDEIEAYRDQVNQLQDKIRNLMINPEYQQQQGKSISNNNKNTTSAPPPLMKSQSEDLTSSSQDSQVNEIKPMKSSPNETSIPNLVEKLTTAEQQREHLMLEYQLLKMKYSKIFMKWEEAKEILKTLGKEDMMSGDITPCTETVQSFTTMIGKINVISDDPQSWGRSYEKEVKDYLKTRINELIGLLQLADSKAVTFYSECVNLQNLLAISADKKNQAESQLCELNKKYSDLQEELLVTKNNYDAQLSTMTDYLANIINN